MPIEIKINNHIAVIEFNNSPVNALNSSEWLSLAKSIDDKIGRAHV